MPEKPDIPPASADPNWFRPPTRREQKMGAGLFLGFGAFFGLMFFVERDSRFRWVILGLGVISAARGLYHLARALVTDEANHG